MSKMKIGPAMMFGFFFGLVYMIGCGSNVDSLEAQATEFGRLAGWDVRGVKCQKYDSDDNGYNSCTVFTNDDGPQAIECAGDYSFNGCAGEGGCRPVFMSTTQKRR